MSSRDPALVQIAPFAAHQDWYGAGLSFRYENPIHVYAVAPLQGSVAGGTAVTIAP